MRYLKYREGFLNIDSSLNDKFKENSLIKEVFQNDTTWGGSLLGRLVNSMLRKGKIYAKSTQIGGIINKVKAELDDMYIAIQPKDVMEKIVEVRVRFLIKEMYETVIGPKSIEEKLVTLLGNDNEGKTGQIQVAIDEVEKIDAIEWKSELIEKLKRLRDALLSLKNGEGIKLDDVKVTDDKTDDKDNKGSENTNTKDVYKSPSFNFYLQTSSLLKSIIYLNDKISNNRAQIKGQESHSSKIIIGKEYIYNGEIVKTVNLKKQVKPGFVFVIFKDKKTNTYIENSIAKLVDIKKLKLHSGNTTTSTNKGNDNTSSQDNSKERVESTIAESFFYESESLPIYENTAVIGDNESHAKSAWSKVSNAYKNSNIKNYIPYIKEILEKSKSGEKLEKKIIIAIGKQVILNESSIGKPISLDQLIKEEAGVLPNEYKEIPKSISLISRIILSFKEDIGLLGHLGELKSGVEKFISSYDDMKKILPSLETKKEESENNEIKKESVVFKYSKFVLIKEDTDKDDFEKPMPKPRDESKEDTDKDDSISDDKVKEEWEKEFKEDDIKKYAVNESITKEVQKSVEDNSNKKVEVDASDDRIKDHIINIVNLFGKAYSMYTTDFIPSGRPEGRISQKTFREYSYIGKGDKNPEWSGDRSPGYGPWASKIGLDKWDRGIMDILSDGKYRRILANVNFKSQSEEKTDTEMKTPGSGKTLFKFINDMLANGEDKDFKSKRHRLLSSYFGLDDKEIKWNNPTSTEFEINPEDAGDTKLLYFETASSAGRPFIKTKFKGTNGYLKEIIKVEYRNEESNKEYLIALLYNSTKDDKLIIKFQLSSSNPPKQSIIDTYLSERIDKENLKVSNHVKFDNSQPIYVTVLDVSKGQFFKIKEDISFKYVNVKKVSGTNTPDDADFKTIKMTKVENLSYLIKLKDSKDGKQVKEHVKVNKIATRPSQDATITTQNIDNNINKFI